MSIVTRARVTGAIYLLYFLTSIGGALLAPGTGPGGLPTDAAAYANSILSHQATYELGVGVGVASTVL